MPIRDARNSRFVFQKNWKYMLDEPYCHSLTVVLSGSGGKIPAGASQNQLLIRVTPGGAKGGTAAKMEFGKGYTWDGPSGPTFDTPNAMRASLVHDGLYQALREGWLHQTARKAADREFREILKIDGMSFLRRWAWWMGVRVFAGVAARPLGHKLSSSKKAIA